jgi:hypothetical protein
MSSHSRPKGLSLLADKNLGLGNHWKEGKVSPRKNNCPTLENLCRTGLHTQNMLIRTLELWGGTEAAAAGGECEMGRPPMTNSEVHRSRTRMAAHTKLSTMISKACDPSSSGSALFSRPPMSPLMYAYPLILSIVMLHGSPPQHH